jgi:putative acetyltransferase
MSREPFLVRPALPEDGAVAQDLVFAILRSYGITPDPEGLDADVVTFGQPGNGALDELVAVAHGRVVGLVSLSEKRDGVGWLSKLFLDATLRRQGIGRALLAGAVDCARARGLHRVELRTRTLFREAVALYEATGWQRGPDPIEKLGPDRTYFLSLDR